MNKRIKELAERAGIHGDSYLLYQHRLSEFAQLLIEEVLDQVKERAYYTGDRDWSDEVDRPWIQLEFGYGPLHNAKTFRS